ncbi:hypothetical protein SAMN05444411_101162 [Lutibacter oricola]|uniref:DKNYY family protein n=1 Tax=Lutibacter oricola TaxID=762486 RepID=A0A1H2R6D0_9FLAO|nr:hypothetical protein [Lutibacter oricola]SDW14957.1 hypothetical protein SAMN05444411_101162 [Lutibacter oricola]
MKIWIPLLFLISLTTAKAQEFKPFKIKSGKITYQKLKYSTVSSYSNKNGVETSYSKQVPYVAEQVFYCWDQFGDIAFEEVYKVSKFGGELLPEKVKITEQLWIDEHHYYFDIKNNKVSDDLYYLRKKCRERFQYYQITDSWIKTLYMGTDKSGTETILDKKADCYKIDKYTDLYAWKGLELKNVSYYTTPKGERLYPNRAKIAVKIDTLSPINKAIFNPTWLKREKFYNSLDGDKISEIVDTRPNVTEQADNIKGIELQKNDIFLFVTNKLQLGKMQVLKIDSNKQLIIKYSLYSFNNEINKNNSFTIKNNTLVNIDAPFSKESFPKDLDFKWSVSNKTKLFPQNNISVLLLKPSRTTLEIKKYKRNN